MTSKLQVRVRRHDGATSRWETFAVETTVGMTVADLLTRLAEAPRLSDGQATSAIVWSNACTWPTCGVCTMLVQGRAMPACTTRVAEIVPKGRRLTLEPLRAFPVIRDLSVNRTRLRDHSRTLDGFVADADPAEVLANEAARMFARCTRCGACMDACPETHERSPFVGPHAFGVVHATRLGGGPALPPRLLDAGGIADCGHVENCVEVCPEAIPLEEAITPLAQGVARRWWKALLGR